MAKLSLEPHPEGGHFKRIYTSPLLHDVAHAQRPLCTSIYYLLTREQPIGRMHRNRSDILHYFLDGGPLEYLLLSADGALRRARLDADSPFLLVPGGCWKASHLLEGAGHALIAEVVTPGADAAQQNWSDFYLSYGVVDLLTQYVGSGLTALGTLNDGTAVEVANQPLLEGHSIKFPVPLPSEDGESTRTCEVGKTVPASTLFKSLDGNAVELRCTFVKEDGNTEHVSVALLANYGIQWWTSYDNEKGHTDIVIRNVTIQRP